MATAFASLARLAQHRLWCQINVVNSPFQCVGLNRHEAEEEEASRERTSDPLGPSFALGIARCTAKRKQGNRWGGGY